MSWNPVHRALRRARLMDACLEKVGPETLKGGRSAIRRAFSTRNAAPEHTKEGFILHPTKGWRAVSVGRSTASIITTAMRTGRMGWVCPPVVAQAAMKAAGRA